MARRIEHRGDPDLTIGGFSIWIIGREFSDSKDYWDANWLVVEARMRASGAVVDVEGPLIRTTEILTFAEQLRKVDESLQGSAGLDCLEPNISLKLTAHRLGTVSAYLSITPDLIDQRHEFEFAIDQTYLAPLARSCEAILERFPVIEAPEESS